MGEDIVSWLETHCAMEWKTTAQKARAVPPQLVVKQDEDTYDNADAEGRGVWHNAG